MGLPWDVRLVKQQRRLRPTADLVPNKFGLSLDNAVSELSLFGCESRLIRFGVP